MSLLRRQYAIDNHLGRYRKALKSLFEINAFDEFKLYTEKHCLFSEALDLYRYQENLFIEIMRMYANYLHQDAKFKEAGIGESRSFNMTSTVSYPPSIRICPQQFRC